MVDFNNSFQGLVDSTFIRINGCLVEKGVLGFKWGDQWFSDIEQVKIKIEESCNNIADSITNK